MAHASNVSSLVLGKASGRLLATGGDDCRVNLWSINKPNCIMVRFGRWAGWGRWAGQGWVLGVGSFAETHHISAPLQLSAQGSPERPRWLGQQPVLRNGERGRSPGRGKEFWGACMKRLK